MAKRPPQVQSEKLWGILNSKADIRNPLCYLLMNAVASRSAFKSLIMQA